MKKIASLEETDIIDPKSKKKIRVSTTTRLLYRKAFPEDYGSMRNVRLNILIAKDFADNADNIIHRFLLKSSSPEQKAVGEIRGGAAFYYIASIKGEFIDILTIQTSWLKPKYKVRADVREVPTVPEGEVVE